MLFIAGWVSDVAGDALWNRFARLFSIIRPVHVTV